MDFMNQDYEIMTGQFTERFAGYRGIVLSREGGLTVLTVGNRFGRIMLKDDVSSPKTGYGARFQTH
jgi:hypothetical protein